MDANAMKRLYHAMQISLSNMEEELAANNASIVSNDANKKRRWVPW